MLCLVCKACRFISKTKCVWADSVCDTQSTRDTPFQPAACWVFGTGGWMDRRGCRCISLLSGGYWAPAPAPAPWGRRAPWRCRCPAGLEQRACRMRGSNGVNKQAFKVSTLPVPPWLQRPPSPLLSLLKWRWENAGLFLWLFRLIIDLSRGFLWVALQPKKTLQSAQKYSMSRKTAQQDVLAGAHVLAGFQFEGMLTDLRDLRCLCRFRCWSAERQFKTGQASHQKTTSP